MLDVIELSGSPSVVHQMIELLQTNLSRTSIIKKKNTFKKKHAYDQTDMSCYRRTSFSNEYQYEQEFIGLKMPLLC